MALARSSRATWRGGEARRRQRRRQIHLRRGLDPLPADIEERDRPKGGAAGAKPFRVLPPADAQRA